MRTSIAIAALMALAACRGSVSEEPPIHVIPDMDWQDKYLPQAESKYFEDGRAMRTPVEGTVARGSLKADDAYYRGQKDGQFIAKVPVEQVMAELKVDSLEKVMKRGQARFNIYCTPCHDQTGSGQGLVIHSQARPAGYPQPINLASEHPMSIGDGEIFSYITNGIRNMPGYGHQIPEADRWAIVSWVRVLQRSQHAKLDDVPEQQRNSIEAEDAQ